MVLSSEAAIIGFLVAFAVELWFLDVATVKFILLASAFWCLEAKVLASAFWCFIAEVLASAIESWGIAAAGLVTEIELRCIEASAIPFRLACLLALAVPFGFANLLACAFVSWLVAFQALVVWLAASAVLLAVVLEVEAPVSASGHASNTVGASAGSVVLAVPSSGAERVSGVPSVVVLASVAEAAGAV